MSLPATHEADSGRARLARRPGYRVAVAITVERAVYPSLSKKDFSETTLIEMTAAGGPKLGLVARGYLESGLRVH